MIECIANLNADSEEQAGLRDHSEGLVIAQIFAVLPHAVRHGRVRDEEEDEGAEATVKCTLEEGHLAEVQVQLPRDVQLRVLETPGVVHILASRESQSPAY